MKFKKYLGYVGDLHWQFVILASALGLIFVFMTPPLWGADESAHFFRAYQISQGDISQEKVTINEIFSNGGEIPKSFDDLRYTTFSDIGNNIPTSPNQVDDISRYHKLAKEPVSSEPRVANPFGLMIYPAITYTAPAIGMLLASLFNPSAVDVLFAGRIATLILYVALIGLSLFVLRKTSVKWIVFVIALLPMSLYQATVISADSLILGLSILIFTLIYNIFHTRDYVSIKNVSLLGLAAVVMVMIKPPYVLLVLILTFLPLRKPLSVRTKRLLRVVIPGLCALIAGLGVLAVRSIIAEPLPGTSSSEQLQWIFDHPLGYAYTLVNSILILNWVPQVIGLFGTSFIFIPGIVFQLLLVILALTAFIDSSASKPKKDIFAASVYTSAGIITSLAVITTLFLTWTPVGSSLIEGIQGRYFLPMVAFVLFGLRLTTSARLVISDEKLKILYPALISMCLIITQLWYFRILY